MADFRNEREENVTLSGTHSGIYGGSMSYGDATAIGITGSTQVTIKNCTTPISKVYGGCKAQSVAGNTSISVLDRVVQNIYGGCDAKGSVNGIASVAIGGNVTIGEDGVGIVLNGGTPAVFAGVNKFNISSPLTGTVKITILDNQYGGKSDPIDHTGRQCPG